MVASNLRFNNLAKSLPFGREDGQQKTEGYRSCWVADVLEWKRGEQASLKVSWGACV